MDNATSKADSILADTYKALAISDSLKLNSKEALKLAHGLSNNFTSTEVDSGKVAAMKTPEYRSIEIGFVLVLFVILLFVKK